LATLSKSYMFFTKVIFGVVGKPQRYREMK
jgi:hypothetical protein